MFSLENTGFVTKCTHQDNTFMWEFPYCITYGIKHDLNLYLKLNFQSVNSPWFSAFNHKWRLALILDIETSPISVGLFLWMMPSSVKAPNIRVKLSIIDKYERGYKSCVGDVDSNGCFGSWNFIPLRDLSSSKRVISPNGVLRISCILDKKVTIPVISETPKSSIATTVADNPVNDEEPEKTESKLKGIDRLIQNLKNLLLDEQTSDVSFKIEDRELKAHRAILKARSSVFTSMFQPHTKESTTGIVDVPDCSASAFEILLLYIYTGSADTISSDNVFDLYYAADKYQIDDLKSECVEFMENNLSVDNFCDIMVLSLKHGETHLQKLATEFFCENVKVIIKTVHWQKYMKDYTTEANELYIKAIGA